MELELAADAEAVADLARVKALQACRDGRSRSQAIKIVWHDSPERTLLADGLTLVEQRGNRQLQRVYPGTATWLPAQPMPVIDEALDPSTLPSPLAPLAAFEGRLTITTHQFDAQPVIMTVAKGILRSVTAQQPAARIWLSGEEQAVRAAAALIAATHSVAVPVLSLAAEGIALATGRPAKARRDGAPVLPTDAAADGSLSVSDALSHILGHLIDVILANAPDAAQRNGESTEAVHQMRVAVRRARSALSIFRSAVPEGALDSVNSSLKDLGTRLGPTRDWDVFAEETVPAIQRAMPNNEQLERLIIAASRRRIACQKDLASYLGSPAFRAMGIELAWFAAARFWHVAPEAVAKQDANPSPTLQDFAGQVLQHRWKKLVSLGKRIEGLDIPALHDVRLRAKRARYAAEMFSTLYQGRGAHRFIRRLSALQQSLGVLNDGAVATHLLTQLGGPTGRHAYATGIVTGFLAARTDKMRPRIVRSFERFRRQPAYWT